MSPNLVSENPTSKYKWNALLTLCMWIIDSKRMDTATPYTSMETSEVTFPVMAEHAAQPQTELDDVDVT